VNVQLIVVALLGVAAQIMNGSLGMGFGVITTSGLLALSLSPAISSSVVHIAEIGTSVFNGTFHARVGNVDWAVLLKVGIPGAVGAFAGALFLSSIDFSSAKPLMAVVLFAMALMILLRFARARVTHVQRRPRAAWLIPLGAFGGILDATGGGGWGTVVTSSLTASRVLEPVKSIGTSTTARIMVALAGSVGFIIGLGAEEIPWGLVGALLVGALIVAPFGPILAKRLPQRLLGLLTAITIAVLSTRTLVVSLNWPAWAVGITFVVVVAGLAVGLFCGLRNFVRERRAEKAELSP
jgi:uncharacterized membrane protein YfcA